MQAASVLVLTLAAVGLIAAFARRLPNPLAADARRGALLIAGLWLGYWAAGVPRYPHYAIILYPWPFVFAAAGAWLAFAWIRTPAARAVGSCGIATAVAAAHIAFTASFARYIDSHPMTGTEYGIPYRDVPPSVVALALVNAGRHDRAIHEFRRALQADPASAALSSDLAWSLAQTGDPRGAVDLLDRTITAHADDKAPRRRLIVLLATNPNVRDTARALALAEDGVQRRPRIPEDYFNRALALYAADRRADAIAAMEDLLAHLPTDHADRPRFQRFLGELQVVH